MREVKEIVTHFVVTCGDKAYVAEAKSMTYEEGEKAAVAFLYIRGGNIITCA